MSAAKPRIDNVVELSNGEWIDIREPSYGELIAFAETRADKNSPYNATELISLCTGKPTTWVLAQPVSDVTILFAGCVKSIKKIVAAAIMVGLGNAAK